MPSTTLRDYVDNDENFTMVKIPIKKAMDVLPDPRLDDDIDWDAFMTFTPDNVPENRPASLLSEDTANEFNRLLRDMNMGASQEHGSGLEIVDAPNNVATPDLVSENEPSLPAESPVQPAALHNAGPEFQNLFPADPTQSTVAHFDGFAAAAGQENTLTPPTGSPTAQSASAPAAAPSTGVMPVARQETATQFPPGVYEQPSPFEDAGANMSNLPWQDQTAQQPAAATNGLMPAAGQEMQLGLPQADPFIYGVSNAAPHQIGQEHGKYVPTITRGKQRNPARKRLRDEEELEQAHDDQEPEQARENQQPEQARDDQEPLAKRAKNRQGATPGYPPLLRHHQRRCLDPATGCDKSCELREKHPDKYEELRTKLSKRDLRHLLPEYRTQLWERIPKPSEHVSQ